MWNGDSGLPIRFRVWFDDDPEPGYTLELRKGTDGWGVTQERIRTKDFVIEVDEDHPFEHPTDHRGPRVLQPPLSSTLRYLVHPYLNDATASPVITPIFQGTETRYGQAFRYRPSAIDISAFTPPPSKPKEKVFVRENGWGVSAALQDLQGEKRDTFEAVEQAVCKLFPHLKGIGFKRDWQGVRLSFRTDRSNELVPAPQESDGVLLATFLFLANVYQPTPSHDLSGGT